MSTEIQHVQGAFGGFGVSLAERVSRAIDLFRTWEHEAITRKPEDGFWLAFSGGKDSIVIKCLAQMAGVKFRAVYNQTTIDPPELVRFIKQHHADVEWLRPKSNFFKAIADSRGLPSRINRWCCEEYKEMHGEGWVKVLGVRKAESVKRKKNWSEVSQWRVIGKASETVPTICPIVDWQDEDVWQFINEQHLPYCSLYDEGWKRLGCIGCPMAGQHRKYEFARWPGFEKAWRTATRRYFERRKGKLNRFGEPYYCERFATSDEYFDWWLSDNPSPKETEQECLGLYDE
jgi:phosphoadenosine phosphosulfate reductase